jgi:hypothetical protein
MSRGGIGIALLISVVAVSLFAPLLLQASNNLRRHSRESLSAISAPRDGESVFHSASVTEGVQRDHG